MANCACTSPGCSCLITAGAGILVTGSGNTGDPVTISAVPVVGNAALVTTDTTTVDMTGDGTASAPLSAIVSRSESPDNLIEAGAPPSFPGVFAAIRYVDTPTVDFTGAGTVANPLMANVLSAGITPGVVADPGFCPAVLGCATPASGGRQLAFAVGAPVDDASANAERTISSVVTWTVRPGYRYVINYHATVAASLAGIQSIVRIRTAPGATATVASPQWLANRTGLALIGILHTVEGQCGSLVIGAPASMVAGQHSAVLTLAGVGLGGVVYHGATDPSYIEVFEFLDH